VVVVLDNPPADIRPGLSCTAKITTATAENAITVPLQAVVERNPSQLAVVDPNAPPKPVSATAKKETPVQGLFVVPAGGQSAVFVPAATGVAGVDQVQVLNGVKPGDEVVTGPYTALRTLANHAKIKVDNSLLAQAAAANSSTSNNN
jgi:HlyD family secretion protein